MKKLALSTATALSVLAAPVAFADAPNTQFYGGLQAGGTFSFLNLTMNSTAGGAPVGFVNVQLKEKKNDNFFTGGVFAGLRFHFDEYFAGLEAEANWDGMNAKFDTAHTNRPAVTWRTEFERRFQVIPSLTFGWKANEKTALYAKFGAGISRFSIKTERGDASTRTQLRTIVHFVPALGAEYEVHKNAALRLEVSGEVAGTKIKSANVAGPATLQSTKTRYNSVSVKFGALFKV